MGEVVNFIKEVKLNYLRDNYRTGFGLFRGKLETDAIKKLVAEINQSIFEAVKGREVRVYRNFGDVVFDTMVPLDKRDKLVVKIPVEIIDKQNYKILWEKASAIPYIRAEEIKLASPNEEKVRERMEVENAGEGEEVEGIPETKKPL